MHTGPLIRRPVFRGPVVVALVLAMLGTALGVAPAAAADPDYGSKFKCRYRTVDGPGLATGDLKKIVITPPTVYSIAKTQTVGWRFILRRIRRVDETSLVTFYRSPIQRATASRNTPAPFTKMSYAVPSLAPEYDFDTYDATLKLIWYRSDGTKQQTVRHWIGSKWIYVDGELIWHVFDEFCERPIQLEFEDGPG
jgi:hypothetical protein